MIITNESQAYVWLAAWAWKPRRGILQAAIDGLVRCVAIAESQGGAQASRGYRDALLVLQQQQRHLNRVSED